MIPEIKCHKVLFTTVSNMGDSLKTTVNKSLPIQIAEHEFDEEDDVPLSLWSRNLNSDSLAARLC